MDEFTGAVGYIMKKFKKILFPIDFSEVSPEIVPYLISMADKLNAEVHIIFKQIWPHRGTDCHYGINLFKFI